MLDTGNRVNDVRQVWVEIRGFSWLVPFLLLRYCRDQRLDEGLEPTPVGIGTVRVPRLDFNVYRMFVETAKGQLCDPGRLIRWRENTDLRVEVGEELFRVVTQRIPRGGPNDDIKPAAPARSRRSTLRCRRQAPWWESSREQAVPLSGTYLHQTSQTKSVEKLTDNLIHPWPHTVSSSCLMRNS